MKLLQMSLAGGVMILVITVIRALAIERLPKKTFLALWAAALARLLAPVSLPSALSIYSLLARRAPAAAEWTAVPALPDLPVAAETAAAAQQTASAPAAQPPVWTIVWAVGAAVCAVVFAAAYGRCCREFRASFPVESDVIRRWLQSHPLRRTVAIRQAGSPRRSPSASCARSSWCRKRRTGRTRRRCGTCWSMSSCTSSGSTSSPSSC